MTAQMQWLEDGAQTSYRGFSLTRPGHATVDVTHVLRNTGTETFSGVRLRVTQSGNSPAWLWAEGTAQLQDALGANVGDPVPFDFDTPAEFPDPFPPNAQIVVTWGLDIPADAPLYGVPAPGTLRAQEM